MCMNSKGGAHMCMNSKGGCLNFAHSVYGNEKTHVAWFHLAVE